MLSNMIKRSTAKTKQQDKVIGFRANAEDQQIIAQIKKRLGIRADSEIIRQALRCLAEKTEKTG